MSTKTDLSWRTLGRPNLDLRIQRTWKTSSELRAERDTLTNANSENFMYVYFLVNSSK